MSQPIFLDMPVFTRASQRVGRHKYPQPVVVCQWQVMELRRIAAADLPPFGSGLAASQAFQDLYVTDTGLMRRCRKRRGSAFLHSDLDSPECRTLLDFITSIRSESDHPYSPLISLVEPGLPFVLSKDPPVRADLAFKYLEKLASVEDEILVPTLAPTLAVSLDQERRLLIATLSCPPTPSPAMHTPTVHFSYETNEGVIAALAADLDVEYTFTPPPVAYEPLPPSTGDEWITKTLADLHRYTTRKGVRGWPSDLPFDVLTQARQSALYAAPFSSPEWLGCFLESPVEQFDHLAGYIDGLQRLLFARYHVIGEQLPPMPSDILIGLDL